MLPKSLFTLLEDQEGGAVERKERRKRSNFEIESQDGRDGFTLDQQREAGAREERTWPQMSHLKSLSQKSSQSYISSFASLISTSGSP